MSDLLTQLMTVGAEILEFSASICATIISQPLLLLTVGFLFAGGCIGIFGRLLSRN